MANPPPPKMPAEPKKPIASWRLKLGKALPYLFALFVLGGLFQIFLAGYGIENLGDQGMDYHITFAHALEMLPLVIVIVGFLGADWRSGVAGIVLFALFFLQYMVLDSNHAAILAVHAANGALMTLIAFTFVLRRLPGRSGPTAASAPPPKPMVSVRPAAPPVHTPTTPRPPTPPQR